MMNKVIAENATKFAQLGNNARLTFQRAGIKSAVRLSPVQRPLPSHKGRSCRSQSTAGSGTGGGKIGGNGDFGQGGGGDGGSGEGSSGGGSGLWGAYLSALETNPIATKTTTSALLNALGDVLSQLFFEEGEAFNWKRTLTFGFLGFALVGPALHFWYGALAKVITQTGTQGALMRLAADQLVFAPAFIAVFFSSLLILEGQSSSIEAKLKQDWKSAVAANWKLWIPFQFINFRFVPQQLQVLMANVVSVGWNTYLSWASHRTLPTEP